MERFKNIFTATHPGIVKDLWTGFKFYCYDAGAVAKYLNKIMEGEADEKDQTKNGSEMAPVESLENS